MYICICNTLKEKDVKRACNNACNGEAVLKNAGCKAQCGKCLDYIESFYLPSSTLSLSAENTAL